MDTVSNKNKKQNKKQPPPPKKKSWGGGGGGRPRASCHRVARFVVAARTREAIVAHSRLAGAKFRFLAKDVSRKPPIVTGFGHIGPILRSVGHGDLPPTTLTRLELQTLPIIQHLWCVCVCACRARGTGSVTVPRAVGFQFSLSLSVLVQPSGPGGVSTVCVHMRVCVCVCVSDRH